MDRDVAAFSAHPHRNFDDWIARLGRAGYLTKGVVYAVVGVLAVQVALGAGGSAEGTTGAILEIGDQPFGLLLLGLTAVGLFGYSLWRFMEAWLDLDRAGRDARGIVKRIGYVVSGVMYLGLSVWCAWIVLGDGSAQGAASGDSQREWTARLLSQPFGQWIVGAVGAIVIAVGLYHLYKAYSSRFMKRYDSGELRGKQRRWARRIGRVGLSARGVTFGIIGGFLVQAAVQTDPGEAQGLGGALQTLAAQPYGPWLMGSVAVGFIFYGVYCASQARYSRFSTA